MDTTLIVVLLIVAIIAAYFVFFVGFRNRKEDRVDPPIPRPPGPTPTDPGPTLYYVLHPCPYDGDQKFLTDTKLTQTGQRVLSGAGKHYMWVQQTTTDKTEGTFIGMVQVLDGQLGCPE